MSALLVSVIHKGPKANSVERTSDILCTKFDTKNVEIPNSLIG
jgi:hypothetical protein